MNQNTESKTTHATGSETQERSSGDQMIRNGSKTQKQKTITAVDFVRAWQRAETVTEVADKLGITITGASSRAANLRKLGVELKKFPRGRIQKLDINELNMVAHAETQKRKAG